MMNDIFNFNAEEIASVCMENERKNEENAITNLTAAEKWSGFCDDVSNAVSAAFSRWYDKWYKQPTVEWDHKALMRLMMAVALMGREDAVSRMENLCVLKLEVATTDEERAETEAELQFIRSIIYKIMVKEGKKSFKLAGYLYNGIACEPDQKAAIDMECDLLWERFAGMSDEHKADLLKARNTMSGNGLRPDEIPMADALLNDDREALYAAIAELHEGNPKSWRPQGFGCVLNMIRKGQYKGQKK